MIPFESLATEPLPVDQGLDKNTNSRGKLLSPSMWLKRALKADTGGQWKAERKYKDTLPHHVGKHLGQSIRGAVC